MAGESDDLHDERLFSGSRVQWLRWVYGYKSLTAYIWHVTQARNKVGLCRHNWTEKLRLSVASVYILVSSVSLETFGKGPKPLSVGRSLDERLDTLSTGRRMCRCHFVPAPVPPVLHETAQLDFCQRRIRAAPAIQRFKRLRLS